MNLNIMFWMCISETEHSQLYLYLGKKKCMCFIFQNTVNRNLRAAEGFQFVVTSILGVWMYYRPRTDAKWLLSWPLGDIQWNRQSINACRQRTRQMRRSNYSLERTESVCKASDRRNADLLLIKFGFYIWPSFGPLLWFQCKLLSYFKMLLGSFISCWKYSRSFCCNHFNSTCSLYFSPKTEFATSQISDIRSCLVSFSMWRCKREYWGKSKSKASYLNSTCVHSIELKKVF